MTVTRALTGISERFTAREIECLVCTAGEAVCGDLEDLTSAQRELAETAFNHLQAENRDQRHASDIEPPASAHPRLLALAEELGIDPDDLDDVVHDLYSDSASRVNNGGLDDQILCLLTQLGEADTEHAIRDSAR